MSFMSHQYVASEAMKANLEMTMTFCEDHCGKDEALHTVVCLGALPSTPKRGEYPTYAHFVSPRKAKTIGKIRHLVSTKSIRDSPTDVVLIPNPAYAPTVGKYVSDTWSPVIASINSCLRHIIYFEMGAVVDNSNTVSESYFKHSWSNPSDLFFCREIGLYIQRYETLTNQANRRFIRDLESLRRHASTSQYQRKIDESNTTDHQYNQAEMQMMEEDVEEIGWSRGDDRRHKAGKLAETLSKLLAGVENIAPTDRRKQYNYIKNHLETDSRHIDAMSLTVFDRWMNRQTMNPQFMKDTELVDSLESLVEGLRSKMADTAKRIGDIRAVSTISDGNELGYDSVLGMLRTYRSDWNLLHDAEMRCAPKEIQKRVHDFSVQVMKYDDERDEPATLAHTDIARLKLNDSQMKGELLNSHISGTTLSQGRVLVGSSSSTSERPPVVFSLYSATLRTVQTDVMRTVRASVPKEILAKDGDTKESLAERQLKCRWLDEIHKHGRGNTLLNGNPANKGPMRRTVAVMSDRPRKIEDLNARDNGRSVVTMPCYICPEQPVVFWSSRPMKQIELAFMMECWLKAWPWLTSDSRRNPPNWMQYVVYNDVQEVHMGMHRDNSKRRALDRMRSGQVPFDDNEMYAGVRNSQARGSNVIVYTMCDSPMEMIFAYPNPEYEVTQDIKNYIRHPCFSFKLGDGYLCVLDPIDDLLMLHGVVWEDLELVGVTAKDGVKCRNRVAFVMRRCESMKDFYTDTSTIRLDAEMMKAMETSTANNNIKEGMGRGIDE